MKNFVQPKRGLLQTTTLVAAGFIVSATPADAADKLKIGVGGFAEQWFGYTDIQDDGNTTQDLSGFDVKSDTEIHFEGFTTLDNGLEVGINVQLEGNTSSDQIDESYLTVRGNFGQIDIGDENSALYKTHVAPKEYGMGINSGDTVEWELTGNTSISNSGYYLAPFGGTFIEPGRADDSTKLTYYTPRVEGFRVGLSYAPDSAQDSNVLPDRNTSSLTDGVMAGIDYSHDFKGVKVAASAGYGTFLEASGNSPEPEAYAFGLTVDYAGFQVGGSYASFQDSGVTDGDAYVVGTAYDFGPFGVSATYLHGERDGIAGSVAPASVQADRDTFALGGRYTLGPGVSLQGTLGYSEYTSDTAGVGDVEAAYAITGIKLTF